MTQRTGGIVILAEDRSDVDALRAIIRRVVGSKIRINGKGAKGCARLDRKASRWLRDYDKKGYTHAIIVRDLDRSFETGQLNDLNKLRQALDRIECPSDMTSHQCIAIEELEAWFWSCDKALRVVIPKDKAKSVPLPETLVRPKERLMKHSRDPGGRAKYSTNKAADLAKAMDLERCESRCPSFKGLISFLRTIPC